MGLCLIMKLHFTGSPYVYTGSSYVYVWNDPVNYADSSGMMGERVGGEGPGDPKKVYGPKGGKLIEGVVVKGVKKSNIAYSFMKMSLNLDKGIKAGVQDYVVDSYNFATKNAYSIKYWEKKGAKFFNQLYLLAILIKFDQMVLQME